MSPRALVFAAVVAGSLLLAPAASAQTPTWLPPESLEARDGSVFELESGTLEVPEKRSKKGGRTITLAFVRLKSDAEAPGTPIFFLAGGPGGSSIEQIRRHLGGGGAMYRAMMGGDIVAVDQRGVGRSSPNLDSPTSFGLPLDEPGDPVAMLERIREVSRAEAARWRAEGVDLTAYTTLESADDLDAVRRALGYEKVSLFGESYGTHLALATIRRHEKAVDRAVLVGPEGPDHTIKLPSQAQQGLEHVARLVAADPEAGAWMPDLLGTLAAVLERLAREPVHADVDGERVGISAFDVQWMLSNLVGFAHGGADRVPALVAAMAAGDFVPFARELAEQRRDFGVGSAMTWMMDCSSGLSKERAALIARETPACLLGDAVDFPQPHVAAAWGAPDLGAAYRGRLAAKTPILFITGDLDSRTPVRNAEVLMRDLPNARLIVVENAGHDLNWVQAELREAWPAFLAGKEPAVTRVVAPPLRFEAP